MVKKAELLDSGAIQALMENGRLRTVNPADRSERRTPNASPQQPYLMPMSPRQSPSSPHSQISQQYAPPIPPKQLIGDNNVVMELPGDFYHTQPSPSFLHPNDNRKSSVSEPSQYSPNAHDERWSTASQSSASSRPSSWTPSDGMRSPAPDHKGFASELPTMQETKEEHNVRQRRDTETGQPKYNYNPQDFAGTQPQYANRPPYPTSMYGQ